MLFNWRLTFVSRIFFISPQIFLFEKHFVSIYLEELSIDTSMSAIRLSSPSTNACTTSLPRGIHNNSTRSFKSNSNLNSSRSTSIVSVSGTNSLSNLQSPKIGFGSIYKKLWHGLLYLCHDPHLDVAQRARTLINHVVPQALRLIDHQKGTKVNNSCMIPPSSPNIRIHFFAESLPVHQINSSNQRNDNPQRLPATFNEPVNKFTLMANNDSSALFQKRHTNAMDTPSEGTSKSQKTSKHTLVDDTVTGKADEKVASSEATDTTLLKPIVSSDFIPWCVSHFSTPIWKPETEQLDCMRRCQRNTDRRRVARGKLIH